jgi:hypothetical protein
MLKIISYLFALMLLASCVNNPCTRAICGCWKNTTYRGVLSVVDAESRPVSGMLLFCETSKSPYGITDESGAVNIKVASQSSPGCGIGATCLESSLRDPDGNFVATVNVTQLLRGTEVVAGEYRLVLLRGSD